MLLCAKGEFFVKTRCHILVVFIYCKWFFNFKIIIMMMIIIMESHKLKVKLGLPPTMKVKIISRPIQGQSILLSNILNCLALYLN
jgi:hypothetical protein